MDPSCGQQQMRGPCAFSGVIRPYGFSSNLVELDKAILKTLLGLSVQVMHSEFALFLTRAKLITEHSCANWSATAGNALEVCVFFTRA